MTLSAIVLMVFAIALFWGGLAYSVLRLRNSPELDEDAPPSSGITPPST